MNHKIKKFLAFFLIAAVAAGFLYWLFSRPQKAEAGWFDESWLYRQIISITNSGVVQTDFQTMITLDSAALITAGKMQSDCDDIRLTDISGKLLSHWIEPGTCNTATTKIWVKVPSIPISGASVYLYYGNLSATSASSTVNTFVREISGVQGAWNMDEASWTNDCSTNTVLDSSGNANHGKSCPNSTGSTGGATGKFNNGGSFDGINDYLLGSDSNFPSGATPSTMMLWFKPNQTCNVNGILFAYGSQINNGARGLTCFSDTQIRYFGWNNDYDVTVGTIGTSWHQVVGVFDGANASLYFDGVFKGTSPRAWNTVLNEFRFGRNFGSWNMYFDGLIDEARIYNRALSQAEITDLYGTGGDRQGYTTTNYLNKVLVRKYSASVSVGSPTSEERGPGPIAYWKFDEGFGQTANDFTINANNGTLGSTAGADANDPVWQTEDMCVTGKCLKFDGVDDRITIPALNVGTVHSASVWIDFQDTGDGIIIGRYGIWPNQGYLIYLDQTNIYYNSGGNSGTDFVTVGHGGLTSGTWYNLAVVRNGTTVTFYKNGVQLGATQTLATNTAITDIASIGSYGNGDYPAKMLLDDVKIYPYARTAGQIKTDYASRGTAKGASAVIGDPPAGGEASMSNGLVGYWKMDEASWTNDCSTSSILDASGAGNNGKACPNSTGPVGGAVGKFGNGGSFDGVDDYVLLADIPAIRSTSAFTISGWFYSTNIALNQDIFAQTYSDSERYVVTLSSSTLRAGRYNGSAFVANKSSTALLSNTWYFFTYTYEVGDIGTLTVNTVNQTGTANPYLAFNIRTVIGAHTGLSSYFYKGFIDEVRIYNRALSPKEVRDLYNFAPGPVGYWKMDENVSGNAKAINDSSGNNNAGTTNWGANASGMNCTTQGKIGGGCQFDGVDDYVDIGNHASLGSDLSQITIEAWVNLNTIKVQRVVSADNGNNAYQLGFTSGGNSLLLNIDTSAGWQSCSKTHSITAGNWVHIAGTWNGATSILYVNGSQLSSSCSTTGTPSLGGEPVYIGSKEGLSEFFNGLIDDVRIYNYARTQKQIVADMNGSPKLASASGGGAVGYWKLDGGYGITANNSGFGGTALNGTLTGMASPATSTSGWTNSGKLGKALNFDGTNDYVDAGNNASLNMTGAYTIAAWIKLNSFGGNSQGRIVDRRHATNLGYQFEVNNNSGLGGLSIVHDNGSNINSNSNVISTGRWYHVAAVYTGSNVNFFVDGAAAGSPSYSTNPSSTTNNLWIGARSGMDRNFNGSIDEVKIYNYALTEDEVKLDYNQGAAVKLGSTSTASNGVTADNSANRSYCIPGDTSTCNPPVGEWNFDEQIGQSANDISGNANIGTLGSTGGVDSADPTWAVSGKTGSALSFDGADDYVDAGNGASLDSDNITIEAWVNTNANMNGSCCLAHNILRKTNFTKYILSGVSGNTYVYAYFGDGTNYLQLIKDTVGSNAVNNGNWHHIAGVKNGINGYLYYDGALVDTKSNASVPSIINPGNLQFGKFFTGSIDDIRIYNYARTPAQIAWDYNRGKPVAEWKFDECQGGTANDASDPPAGGGNNGTIIIGATVPQTVLGTCITPTDGTGAWYNGRNGKINSAMSFDGVDDYVSVGNAPSLNITGAITISAWIKTTYNGYMAIVDKRTSGSYVSGYVFWQYGSNNAFLGLSDGSSEIGVYSTSAINDGVWHHIAGTWSGVGNYLKIYVDGKFEADSWSVKNNAIITNANPLYIGYSLPNNGDYFSGLIDDVKIYNYALTPLQVQTEYNNGAVNFK